MGDWRLVGFELRTVTNQAPKKVLALLIWVRAVNLTVLMGSQ